MFDDVRNVTGIEEKIGSGRCFVPLPVLELFHLPPIL
jgi:hypothetical protein